MKRENSFVGSMVQPCFGDFNFDDVTDFCGQDSESHTINILGEKEIKIVQSD